jgi:hypothetical protein
MVTDTKLYTVVLDHAGGTYIGQEPSSSASEAVFQWIASIPDEELIRWGITREELAGIARSDQLVPLAGLLNVWCISGSTKRGLALIDIIATDQSAG